MSLPYLDFAIGTPCFDFWPFQIEITNASECGTNTSNFRDSMLNVVATI